MTIDPSTTVTELALERPGSTRIFERLGLDYCCGGKRSLAAACERRGLDLATVTALLDGAEGDAADRERERDWRRASIAELCEHIVSVHHAYLRTELPCLSGLLEKVERAHGSELPELAETRAVFERLRAELESHIADEELRLFPALEVLEAAAERPSPALLEELEDEHAEAGAALERLRELTGGYDEARARCSTHRATLAALHELELDVHQHIHEENNVLFPRALAS